MASLPSAITESPMKLRVFAMVALLGGTSDLAARPQEGPDATTANPDGRQYPPRVYRTVRLQGEPPKIDGRLDDEAWQEGEWAGDYTQWIPTEGAEPSHPTELKILYDDENVYAAIRAYDDLEKTQRYPGRRDAFVGDIVGVCFDSYFDKRTGFEFDLSQKPDQIVERVMQLATSLGGVISGEHGIGLTKFQYLHPETIAAFEQYKQRVDPKGAFNRGKLLPAAGGAAAGGK